MKPIPNTNTNPLLSICIPTYNRGDILRKALEQYINNSEFDDEVELVISDNCSEDDTAEICNHYCRLKNNIKYFRNEQNIRDKNFIEVLNHASGEYLKLSNDWVFFDRNALAYMKSIIRENINAKTPLFFTSGTIFTNKKAEVVRCKNLDEYVSAISTFVTYNNLFGVWRLQWCEVSDRSKYAELQLQQVDWAYQIVSKNNGCILFDKSLFKSIPPKKFVRSGYNWFKVHLDNYYKIMMPYVKNGQISACTLKRDKHYLLEHFKPEFCWTYFYNYNKEWRFETKGTISLLWKYYRNDPYVIWYFMKLPFFYTYMTIKKTARYMLYKVVRRHNHTFR